MEDEMTKKEERDRIQLQASEDNTGPFVRQVRALIDALDKGGARAEATERRPLDLVRVSALSERFPVLGRTTWNALVARGEVESFTVGRARFVRASDVVAFLLSKSNSKPSEPSKPSSSGGF